MAEQIIRDAKFLFDGYDLTGYMNALAVNYSCNLVDKPALGNASMRRLPGLTGTSIQHEGYFEVTPDGILLNKIGSTGAIMSMSPVSDGADGSRAFTVKCIMGQYNPGGAVGDMFAFSVAGESDSNLARGLVMHNATRASTGNGTARQIGAVASDKSLFAALHILSASGSSPTLDVDISSDDNAGMTSATLQGSFAQASAIGAQWLEVPGPITDDYYRVDFTIGGGTPSFNFVVVIGIG